jgi:hypothetical protein
LIRSVPISAALRAVVTCWLTITLDVIGFNKFAKLLIRPPFRVVGRNVNALPTLLAFLVVRKHSLLSWADAFDPGLSNALHGQLLHCPQSSSKIIFDLGRLTDHQRL